MTNNCKPEKYCCIITLCATFTELINSLQYNNVGETRKSDKIDDISFSLLHSDNDSAFIII